jgi:L-lactate dehydrogenase complex protein LldG
MNTAVHNQTREARSAILQSIRSHLAESLRANAVNTNPKPTSVERLTNGGTTSENAVELKDEAVNNSSSPVEIFRKNLEMVGGHCIVVRDETSMARSLTQILAGLQSASQPARRIALSDSPLVSRLLNDTTIEFDDLTISPDAKELFGYDVGICTAQAAIAETGTLVLESDLERNRLVSLLPPVHIAIVKARDICRTLGDALRDLRREGQPGMSRAITFITGPSRTADIELTLTIGVHGPKELYVIVYD